jgi:hypothetical protein
LGARHLDRGFMVRYHSRDKLIVGARSIRTRRCDDVMAGTGTGPHAIPTEAARALPSLNARSMAAALLRFIGLNDGLDVRRVPQTP